MPALYYEVKPWNISVTLVQPGFMRSDAFEKVPYTNLSGQAFADGDHPYYAHYHHMDRCIASCSFRRSPHRCDV
ncbi:hypothetical protein [Stieleria mannarensis]|uniref:hypothetical protein n=1 Tax=Stieleria mannarensis TaxID=2755585 RepID=UPI00256FE9E7|nr:hypothetical protein [Rhodopirellula sp. JC639]